MNLKYVVDCFDDVIFIGTTNECLEELNTNPNAKEIRDTRYRKSVIEKMEMIQRRR